MSILSRQLSRIIEIIRQYDYSQPYPNYLAAFFRKHPEMGSRDRKLVKEWSYAFFRTGKSLGHLKDELRITIGAFLMTSEQNASMTYLLETYAPELLSSITKSLEEKLAIVKKTYPEFDASNIFPLSEILSPQIDKAKWIQSFLIQPEIYIRIRESMEEKVLTEFREKNIEFHRTTTANCFLVKNMTQPELLKSYRQGAFEFQDKMSQQTQKFFKPNPGDRWWDACAASGGKSLLLLELQEYLKIEATDVRPTILQNYSERMTRAGWKGKFHTAVKDLTKPVDYKNKFDGIIADVPCSGSGTWSRNPEWLSKYQLSDISQFVTLQRTIVNNLLPALAPGKPFIYITCSAFFPENEDNIRFFEAQYGLKTEEMNYLSGYPEKADTLFVCRMKMP